MRAMKDSGVEWIGIVPEHWEMRRAKAMFRQSTSKGNDRLVLLSATQDRGVVDKSTLDSVVQVSEDADLSTFKTVHKNDFVISLRSFQGGFEISHEEGVISPAYTVFRLSKQTYPHFYRHLFKSYGFIDKINSLTVGIREGKNIQYVDFADMLLPYIPLAEQQRIAEFLDRKCAEVDEMIALQEQIIEELKAYKQSVITEAVTKGLNPAAPMRDSGIEWIGSIPEHWEVHRIKNHFSIISGSGFDVNLQGLENGELPICKASDISRADKVLYAAENYLSREVALTQKFNIIPIGSIIFPKIGEAMKKNRRAICAVECCVDNNCQALVPNGINNIYSYYLLCCIKMEWYDNAGTIPSISNQKLRIEHIPFPTPTEQQVIADYLDEKCDEIDKLIAIKQQKIENLKEYKKSIIYEYVTGKKEVE